MMTPQKLSAIFLIAAGGALVLGGQWAMTPGKVTGIDPPILGIAIAATPLIGFILLALGLYRLYNASK